MNWLVSIIYISGRRACMKDGLFLEMIGLPHTNQKKQAIAMYHTTGFSSDELIDICVLITSVDREPGTANWPPCLGLLDSVVATLAYLRHNRTQAEIGESLGVSQPTISRAITVITPLLSAALAGHVATADDLYLEAQYIVDGTLLPCWSWAGCTELYSGKHKTTGMNVQVACTIYGKLAWISDPVNGSRHDNYCLGESDVLRMLDPKNWIGDKGYIGNEMITPFRKPEGRELLDWQKEFNTRSQQDPLDDRAGYLALQELDRHAHRLSPPAQHVRDNYLSGNWLAFLPDGLNNSPCLQPSKLVMRIRLPSPAPLP